MSSMDIIFDVVSPADSPPPPPRAASAGSRDTLDRHRSSGLAVSCSALAEPPSRTPPSHYGGLMPCVRVRSLCRASSTLVLPPLLSVRIASTLRRNRLL